MLLEAAPQPLEAKPVSLDLTQAVGSELPPSLPPAPPSVPAALTSSLPDGWAPPIDEGAGAALLNDVELGLLGSAPAPAPPAVTTHDPEVAERRRQKARAMLEERLKMKAEEPPPTSPTPKSVEIAV